MKAKYHTNKDKPIFIDCIHLYTKSIVTEKFNGLQFETSLTCSMVAYKYIEEEGEIFNLLQLPIMNFRNFYSYNEIKMQKMRKICKWMSTDSQFSLHPNTNFYHMDSCLAASGSLRIIRLASFCDTLPLCSLSLESKNTRIMRLTKLWTSLCRKSSHRRCQ